MRSIAGTLVASGVDMPLQDVVKPVEVEQAQAAGVLDG